MGPAGGWRRDVWVAIPQGLSEITLWLEANMGLIILVVLIVLLVGSFPAYPYSREWGYYPAGGLGTLLLILLILMLLGVFPARF
jgi:hypothetical protein